MKKTKVENFDELNFFKFNDALISVSNDTLPLLKNPPLEKIPVLIYFQKKNNIGYYSEEGVAFVSSIKECTPDELSKFMDTDKSKIKQFDF